MYRDSQNFFAAVTNVAAGCNSWQIFFEGYSLQKNRFFFRATGGTTALFIDRNIKVSDDF